MLRCFSFIFQSRIQIVCYSVIAHPVMGMSPMVPDVSCGRETHCGMRVVRGGCYSSYGYFGLLIREHSLLIVHCNRVEVAPVIDRCASRFTQSVAICFPNNTVV